MTTIQIQNLHQQILELYRVFVLPIITQYFNNTNIANEKVDIKNHKTLVTQADFAINEVLTEALCSFIPDSKVISEESKDNTIGEYTFIIDPIDGTHTFARNLDDWGISIVLYHKTVPIYSVIFYPNLKTEYFYAIKDIGAFDSNNCRVTRGEFFKFKPLFFCAPSSRQIGRALIDFTKGRQLSFGTQGSAVYAGYALFRGGADFILFDHLSTWDVLGCIFIAEQIGLKVRWFGRQPIVNQEDDITKINCTVMLYKPDFDPTLFDEIISVIDKNFL